VKKIIGWAAAILLGVVLLLATGYRSEIPVSELEKSYWTKESDYVTVGDAKLHVRRMGQGPMLLLIHGSFASLHTWEIVQKELAHDFTTISVDLPAHGLTGPIPSARYSTDDFAQLMFGLIDQMKIDTFSIAGNSMGGQVAWKMALHKPSRIRKLILIDAAGIQQTIAGTTSKPLLFTLLQYQSVRKVMSRITPRFVFRLNMQQVYANPDAFTDEVLDRYYLLMRREGNRDATMLRLQQVNADLQDSIQFIQTPTLVLWGAQDRWIPLAAGEQFHRLLPNDSMIVLPDAGHVPMEEVPEKTVTILRQFLQGQRN